MFEFRFRQEVIPGPIYLRNELFESESGSRQRLFYVGSAFRGPCSSARRRAGKLRGLLVIGVEDRSSLWSMEFEYEGSSFLIESNSHGTTSLFFVADEACPDSTLMAVVFHFESMLE